jgi:hypothetical protein
MGTTRQTSHTDPPTSRSVCARYLFGDRLGDRVADDILGALRNTVQNPSPGPRSATCSSGTSRHQRSAVPSSFSSNTGLLTVSRSTAAMMAVRLNAGLAWGRKKRTKRISHTQHRSYVVYFVKFVGGCSMKPVGRLDARVQVVAMRATCPNASAVQAFVRNRGVAVLGIRLDRQARFDMTGRTCGHRQVLDPDGHGDLDAKSWPRRSDEAGSSASGIVSKSQTFQALIARPLRPVGGSMKRVDGLGTRIHVAMTRC